MRLKRLLFTLTIAIAAFSTVSASHAEITELQPQREVVWKDFLGVNAHFLWFTPGQYRQQMQQLQNLGLQWVRVDLHWDQMEPQEGQFRLNEMDGLVAELRQRQLKSLFYLVGSAPFITSAPAGAEAPDAYPPRDPAVFAYRMGLFANRYPTIDAWQVWNEPNLPAFWRPREDPLGYAQLLQSSALALRQVQPNKPVVMGGMAYYSQMPGHQHALMFEALGNLGVHQLGTILAYHPYSLHPEGDEPAERDFILRNQTLSPLLRSIAPPAIWATEWGWSSYAGPVEEQPIIGEQGQADYVLRRLALMSALDFDRIFLFALSDLDNRATIRDRSYGLLNLQGQPKPVYQALKRFLDISGPRLTPAQPPRPAIAPDDLYSIGWIREDGRRIWLFWSASAGSVTLPDIATAELHDPLTGSSTPLQSAHGLEVTAKPSLQMLVY